MQIARIVGTVACCAGLCAAAPAAAVASTGAKEIAAGPASNGAVVPSADAPLTVGGAYLAANGSMVKVQFQVPASKTTRWIPTDGKDTYLIDELSGEKYFVLNLTRIGPVAQTRIPKGGGSSYMYFDNRHEDLRAGAKVTVVIGATKLEHVTLVNQ